MRDRVLRRRRDLRGRVPRGRELRRRDAGAARPPLQQQPVGDLDAALARRRRAATLADKAVGYGMPGRARRRRRRARRLRGDARGGRRARGPATARRSSRRSPIARRRTRRPTTRALYIDPERVEEERERECVGRYEGYLRRLGLLDDACRGDRGGGGRRRCARGSRRPRPSRRPTVELVFDARLRRPAAVARARPRRAAAGILGDGSSCSSSRRSTTRCTSSSARDDSVMVMGEDVGRLGGVFRATAGLRDRFGRRPLRRHAARRGRASSAPRSASAWPAGGPCARCSTTRSPTRASTS